MEYLKNQYYSLIYLIIVLDIYNSLYCQGNFYTANTAFTFIFTKPALFNRFISKFTIIIVVIIINMQFFSYLLILIGKIIEVKIFANQNLRHTELNLVWIDVFLNIKRLNYLKYDICILTFYIINILLIFPIIILQIIYILKYLLTATNTFAEKKMKCFKCIQLLKLFSDF